VYPPRMRAGMPPTVARLLSPSGQASDPTDTWHPYVAPTSVPTDIPVASPEAMGHTCAEWLNASDTLKSTTLAQFFTSHHYPASDAFIHSEVLRIDLDCRNPSRVPLTIVQHDTAAPATTTTGTHAPATTSTASAVPWGWIAAGVGAVAVVGGVTWMVLSRNSRKRSKSR